MTQFCHFTQLWGWRFKYESVGSNFLLNTNNWRLTGPHLTEPAWRIILTLQYWIYIYIYIYIWRKKSKYIDSNFIL